MPKVPQTKTKASRHMPKDQRQSKKMWADGTRSDILTKHIPGYAAAVEEGRRAELDYLQRVCNEYNTLIPWYLQDHEEPNLPLPDYDPLAPHTPPTDLTPDEARAREEKHAENCVVSADVTRDRASQLITTHSASVDG